MLETVQSGPRSELQFITHWSGGWFWPIAGPGPWAIAGDAKASAPSAMNRIRIIGCSLPCLPAILSTAYRVLCGARIPAWARNEIAVLPSVSAQFQHDGASRAGPIAPADR